MLDASGIRKWRAKLRTTHAVMWQHVMKGAERLKRSEPPVTGRLSRGHGNRMAALAVVSVLSEDEGLKQTAIRYLVGLCRRSEWDPNRDLLHGHILWGVAIGYDWLWQDLTAEQRQLVRNCLAREAQRQFLASTEQRGWWRNQYLQNHGHVNLCGLAYAAAALYGEDERAEQWLSLADAFFSRTFEVSNPDGVSIEGLSYGAYALEFCLRYADLARQALGKDYYGCPWLKRFPLYIAHSTLPVMTRHEWAMTFGDSPRAANSHLPTHSMARIAAEYRDPIAQGACRMLQDLHGGLGRDPWQTVLWYDPSVPAVGREDLPTFHHFSDVGQVMMRTDWSSDAMLVGLKCGPWLGHNLWHRVGWDYGAAHEHPDVNSFQIYAYGAWLAVDPGYTLLKRTCNHNTLLIDGYGQLGEGKTWFSTLDALYYHHYAKILRAEQHGQYDYVAADGTGAYHPGLALRRFVRHFIFLKPLRVLILVDDIATETTGYYRIWARDDVQFEGMKIESPRSEFVVPARADRKGRVWFVFDGPAGTYDIDVGYFDNWPGSGRYTVVAGGNVVEQWVHEHLDTDLHLRSFRGVALRPGDKVELRGEPFGKPGKFIKFVVHDRRAPRNRPHEIALMLHTEPDAKIDGSSEKGLPNYSVRNAQAVLDVWLASPEGVASSVRPHDVVRGRGVLKRTKCIEIRPELQRYGDEDWTVVVTVLHARKPDMPGLDLVRAKVDRSDRSAEVELGLARQRWRFKVSLEGASVRCAR